MAHDQEMRIRVSLDTSALRRGMSEVENSAKKVSSGFGNLDKSGSGAMDRITGSTGKATSAFKGMAKAAVGIAAGMVAIGGAKSIIDGVIDRVDAIQGAKKTMTLLFKGDTSKAEVAVKKVQDAVEGTPFTMSFAMGETSKLIAAGLNEITASKAFTISADIAATFKPNEIETATKELNDIFVKGMAKGSFGMKEMESLQTRGIPILKDIAEEFGMTEEAARKFVKDGKLGVDEYQQVMSKYAGASQEAGNSIRGAMKNISTAIIAAFAAPLGEDANYDYVVEKLVGVKDWIRTNLAPEISSAMKKAFEMMETIVPIIEASASAIVAIYQSFKNTLISIWKSISSLFKSDDLSIPDSLIKGLGWIEKHAGAIGGALAVLVGAFAALQIIGLIGGLVGGLVKAFAFVKALALPALLTNPWILGLLAIIAVIGLLFAAWQKFKGFFEEGGAGIQGVIDYIGTGFENLIDKISNFGETIGSIDFGGLAQKGIEMIQGLIEGFVSAAPMILSALIPVLLTAFTGLMELRSTLITVGLELLEGLIEGIMTALPMILEVAVDIITGLIEGLMIAIPMIIEAAMNIITALVEGILTALPVLAGIAIDLLLALIDGITTALPMILEAAMTIITTLLEGIVTAIPMIIEAALGIVTALIEGLVAAAPMIVEAAVQLIQGLIQGIIEAVPLIIEGALALITGLLEAIIELLPMIIEGAVAIVMALIEGIIEAVPMIIEGAIILLTALVEAIAELLPMLVVAAIDIVMALLEGIIGALPMIIEGAIQLVLALVEGIISMLPVLIESIVILITSILEALVTAIPLLLVAGIELLMGLLEGIITMIPTIVMAIIELVIMLIAALIQAIPQFIMAAVELVVALITGIVSMIGNIVSAMWDLIKSVVAKVIEAAPEFLAGAQKWISDMVSGISSKVGDVLSGIGTLLTSVLNKVKEFSLLDAGKDLVRGLINGIGSMKDAAVEKIAGVVNGVVNKAKSLLGIKSPSRVFRDEVGKMLTQGLAIGIEADGGKVIKALTDLNGDMLNTNLSARMSVDEPYYPEETASQTVIYFTGNIREEADVRKLANELDKLSERKRRFKGEKR